MHVQIRPAVIIIVDSQPAFKASDRALILLWCVCVVLCCVVLVRYVRKSLIQKVFNNPNRLTY